MMPTNPTPFSDRAKAWRRHSRPRLWLERLWPPRRLHWSGRWPIPRVQCDWPFPGISHGGAPQRTVRVAGGRRTTDSNHRHSGDPDGRRPCERGVHQWYLGRAFLGTARMAWFRRKTWPCRLRVNFTAQSRRTMQTMRRTLIRLRSRLDTPRPSLARHRRLAHRRPRRRSRTSTDREWLWLEWSAGRFFSFHPASSLSLSLSLENRSLSTDCPGCT